MTELKRCPFCGKADTVVYDEMFNTVVCSRNDGGCGASSMTGGVEVWNTRYTPTCTNLYHEGSTLGEGGFRCSDCDVEVEGDEPKYCPKCGAKVMSE